MGLAEVRWKVNGERETEEGNIQCTVNSGQWTFTSTGCRFMIKKYLVLCY